MVSVKSNALSPVIWCRKREKFLKALGSFCVAEGDCFCEPLAHFLNDGRTVLIAL